jgi:hypothetical protein
MAVDTTQTVSTARKSIRIHGNKMYVSREPGHSSPTSCPVSQASFFPSIVPDVESRQSLTSRSFTGGLVLMDAVHMPTGCGTWPAWWQNGPNWPYGGEIDILEGVNAFTENQVSLHTGSGCTMPSNQNDLQLGTLTTGSFNSYDCASYDTSNQGCGVRDQTNDNSYGASFNNVGGGVYASEWEREERYSAQ